MTFQGSRLAEELKLNLFNNIKKHGETYYVRFGKFVRLIVFDPLMVQQIIAQNADCYEKPSFITALDILGDGIFSVSGKYWMTQRQILAKCFIMKELKVQRPHSIIHTIIFSAEIINVD